MKTEQDLQDSGFQVLNQDLSDYGGAFLKAEQDLNHTAPERLEQHLYNPGSVINNVEQCSYNSGSAELQHDLLDPGSTSVNVEQDMHDLESEEIEKHFDNPELRAAEDCLDIKMLNQSVERNMLIKFNIHRGVVRVERLNIEASSCQSIRVLSPDNECRNCGKRFRQKCNSNVHAGMVREDRHECMLCDSCLQTKMCIVAYQIMQQWKHMRAVIAARDFERRPNCHGTVELTLGRCQPNADFPASPLLMGVICKQVFKLAQMRSRTHTASAANAL